MADRFDAIAEWRGAGETWEAIGQRLFREGLVASRQAVRIAFERESRRRRDPGRVAMLRWLHANLAEIKVLREQGCGWDMVLALVPPDFDTAQPGSDFAAIVAGFRAIERSRSSVAQEKEMHTALAAVPAQPPGPAVAAPKPSQDSRVESGQASKQWMSSASAPRLKPVPVADPYQSGPELRARVYAAREKRNALRREEEAAPPERKAELRALGDVADREGDQLETEFLYRFSDWKATKSKLCLLSSAALACGAYVVCEEETVGSITLRGYDRPEKIDGLDVVPDPLVIREDLTNAERDRIAAAHADDGPDHTSTPVLLLAEAVLVRGEYLIRGGWHEYDTLVRLSGADLPANALTGASTLGIRTRSIDLWPRLTGAEPVKLSEWEIKQEGRRPDPELERRGEWT